MRKSLRNSSLSAAVGLGLCLAVMPAQPAHAATTVPCNDITALRDAIDQANLTGETVQLAAGCTYTLTDTDNESDGLPEITGDVTISGQNATIRRSAGAADDFRIFHVKNSGSLSLLRVNVSGGRTNLNMLEGFQGGGIWNEDGSLSLTQSNVTGNQANRGGGVYNSGTLSWASGTLRNNSTTASFGGGLNNQGSAALTSVSIADNTSASDSGGIENCGSATLRLTSSPVTGNRAASNGGGIYHCGVSARLVNSPVTGNTAGSVGGGIFVASSGASLVSSPVTNNTPDNCFPDGALPGCTNPAAALRQDEAPDARSKARHLDHSHAASSPKSKTG